MSFTRRPGTGCPQQTSRREHRHIVRNARVQPTASSAAIQAQETGLQRNGTRSSLATNPDLISSDDNRVRLRRPRGVRLSPDFALQQHTAHTAGVTVWSAIAYNKRSPLVLIHNTRPHTAKVSHYYICTVTTLPWPARSPDLSPIEYKFDHLGWRVGHPTILNELEGRLQQIWNKMSQDIIQNLYASMPDRIVSCIRARRGN
ncbi:transposable element Tcb1 transposase [Trichonephila clavipes]|nr:transposable element Tcb1 transposase [Trichonephila clavipes]